MACQRLASVDNPRDHLGRVGAPVSARQQREIRRRSAQQFGQRAIALRPRTVAGLAVVVEQRGAAEAGVGWLAWALGGAGRRHHDRDKDEHSGRRRHASCEVIHIHLPAPPCARRIPSPTASTFGEFQTPGGDRARKSGER